MFPIGGRISFWFCRAGLDRPSKDIEIICLAAIGMAATGSLGIIFFGLALFLGFSLRLNAKLWLEWVTKASQKALSLASLVRGLWRTAKEAFKKYLKDPKISSSVRVILAWVFRQYSLHDIIAQNLTHQIFNTLH